MGNTTSFRKEFGLIIVGALIFTASFLWKDLLTEIEEVIFPKGYCISGRILYVIIITIILVSIAVHLKGVLGLSNYKTYKFDDDPDKNKPRDLVTVDEIGNVHMGDDN